MPVRRAMRESRDRFLIVGRRHSPTMARVTGSRCAVPTIAWRSSFARSFALSSQGLLSMRALSFPRDSFSRRSAVALAIAWMTRWLVPVAEVCLLTW
jgi:hypothetical protein